MHITLEADYAVRIVDYLSTNENRQDANTISQTTSVPLRFALKILRKLVEKGIVKSYRGANGGYVLSRHPSEITLCEVIECVEGRYFISRCLSGEYKCDQTCCKFHKIYDDISNSVREKLSSVTFDMISKK